MTPTIRLAVSDDVAAVVVLAEQATLIENALRDATTIGRGRVLARVRQRRPFAVADLLTPATRAHPAIGPLWQRRSLPNHATTRTKD